METKAQMSSHGTAKPREAWMLSTSCRKATHSSMRTIARLEVPDVVLWQEALVVGHLFA